jgi:hypothetical protein
MAGYSGTPLDKKLGITPGARVLVVDAPDGFVVPGDGDIVSSGPVDVALVFVRSRAALEAAWASVAGALLADGAFWVAWPKKASKVPTDMTEDVVREVALPRGLVDNKVCAIDDVWSGLRLVVRKEHRETWQGGEAGTNPARD